MRVIVALLFVACTASTRTPMPAQREADPIANVPAPPNPCRGTGDCAGSNASGDAMVCFAPDYEPGRGARECEDDHACPKGSRCRGGACVAPCTPTSCAAGQECGDDGDCEPRRCDAGNAARACPHNFSCQQGHCLRMPCTSDSACEGACVDGHCYPHPGRCEPQSYCCPP